MPGRRAASPAYSATAQKPSSMRLMTASDKIAGNTTNGPRSEGRDVTSSRANAKIVLWIGNSARQRA